MTLDPLFLFRLQWAWVIGWHILLPAFTVGLASSIAVLERLFDKFIARYLNETGDWRQVASGPEAQYFGGRVEQHSLVPPGEARLGHMQLYEWLRRHQAGA